MDKKSWPWKKKLSEKMSSSPNEVSDASPQSASKQSEEQEASSSSASAAPSEDSSSELSSKAKDTADSSADADMNAKDELVKQHMKIAEEAVAGWEKAEAEAVDLKEKLEAAMQQKFATEDRVSHLDGALKECMKQLRHVREEQEQKIHDAVVKKTREWEKVRTDLEARLDDATNELCEALAENQAMSKSLQERAITIAEISDMKAHLEADSSALQVRLASAEKENARFKYELHVLSKELELRNGEQEYVKRAEEAANKLNLERSKKIAKLEEECQRLKLLVKKRQPSPAPMSHMRGEADPIMNERIRRRSPCRRSTTFLPLKVSDLSGNDFGLDDGLKEENRILSDQLLAMQDEAKSLRELLVKKDDELKSVRLLCARTANKLSEAEKQHDIQTFTCGSMKSPSAALLLQKPNGGSLDLSNESVSGESGPEVVCAESWASALIAELAHIKGDNTGAVCDKLQVPITIDLMDDFAEMEKLASSSSPGSACNFKKAEKFEGSTTQNCAEKLTLSGGSECSHEQGPGSFNEPCNELRDKLTAAESRLHTLQEKQSVSDATINQLQQMLALKFGLEAEGDLLRRAIEAAKLAIEGEKGDSAEMRSREMLAKSDCEKQSAWEANFTSPADPVSLRTSETEICGIGADLAAAVRKVLDIVESIGQTDYNFPYAEWISAPSLENDGMPEFSSPGKQWRSSGLDACVESLINLCNSLVQGKVDIIDFIAEVASALDWLVGLIFTLPDKTSARIVNQRIGQTCAEQVDNSDSEMISAESSPTQLLCNASDGEDAKISEPHDVLPDQSSVSNLSFQFSESSVLDEDVHKNEEITLKASLEAEMRKSSKYESEILRLKVVNDQLEQGHEHTIAKLADLEAQVAKADKMIQKLSNELMESQKRSISLEDQLQDLFSDKQSLESAVADLDYAKNTLESEMRIARDNVEALEMKVIALEEELSNEMRCHKETELQLFDLKEELKLYQGDRSTLEQSEVSNEVEDEATRLRKEQEIVAAAEKLAECQQTILDLGKQLKALGVSKTVFDVASAIPSESPSLANQLPLAPTQRARSASDQVCSSVTNTQIDMQCNGEPMPIFSSRNERDRKQEQSGLTKSSKKAASLSQEEPGTPVAKRGGQAIGKLGRQGHLDVYNNHRNNHRFPSPTHEDKDGAQGGVANSHTSTEPVVNSPLRSPARFLSLRGKNTHEPSKHGDNEAAEKHGSSGFSRFFARTKSGH
ncbi:hypothetical protein GOP47_0019602 [Adiantum capillus-veneris]|uniref:Filament-like plant protein 7 n=1 Tax=Adiantum capillus-veneris TaxID=13818 RepID=A0A9D4UBT4_ADICA|nr:hypothetical protein GOP47_0019602 [Adiantum capillus-veneris]